MTKVRKDPVDDLITHTTIAAVLGILSMGQVATEMEKSLALNVGDAVLARLMLIAIGLFGAFIYWGVYIPITSWRRPIGALTSAAVATAIAIGFIAKHPQGLDGLSDHMGFRMLVIWYGTALWALVVGNLAFLVKGSWGLNHS